MQQIVNFILRNKTFLLFLLLFFISIIFTIQSHSYHKSKFINSANFLTGGVYNTSHRVSGYFGLKEQNLILQEENTKLKTLLYNTSEVDSKRIEKTMLFDDASYNLFPAQIIKNSYANSDNILTINKGKRDSLEQDFGVITSKGILGIVDNTSSKFATVLSILNTNSRISAQLKNTDHFGSLVWDAKSPEYIQLSEIPQKAKISKGDTIITSGRSAIFPKGIPVGTVDQFNIDQSKSYYEINVKLFNDMTNIKHVYIIENKDKKEIESLTNPNNE